MTTVKRPVLCITIQLGLHIVTVYLMQRVNNIQCENLSKLLALSLGLTLLTAMHKVTMYHIAGKFGGH